ncbi:Cobalamin synthase [hydrothermal vent metagenome]|uniref:Adenosylcobinamide-GDP ribazoletransferase n=1 Tax=hydrothermal vent metagenome TaxID=652676 RepID=A0A3B0ZTV8_9ZZZZ
MSSWNTYWWSLISAIRFLTIIPIPVAWPKEQDTQSVQAGSILFYPMVGLLVGLTLLTLSLFLNIFSDGLAAIILLTVWIIVTGALHLDGLADSADAWLGGHGNKEKTLLILQDTHSGVAAIVAVVLVLLFKLILLSELNSNLVLALLLSPIIARTAVTGLLVSTPYVRENGIASVMMSSLPVKSVWISLLIIAAIISAWLGWNGIVIVLSVAVAVMLFRFMLYRRIGGTTGDTAGALIELIEVLVLFNFVVLENL